MRLFPRRRSPSALHYGAFVLMLIAAAVLAMAFFSATSDCARAEDCPPGETTEVVEPTPTPLPTPTPTPLPTPTPTPVPIVPPTPPDLPTEPAQPGSDATHAERAKYYIAVAKWERDMCALQSAYWEAWAEYHEQFE